MMERNNILQRRLDDAESLAKVEEEQPCLSSTKKQRTTKVLLATSPKRITVGRLMDGESSKIRSVSIESFSDEISRKDLPSALAKKKSDQEMLTKSLRSLNRDALLRQKKLT